MSPIWMSLPALTGFFAFTYITEWIFSASRAKYIDWTALVWFSASAAALKAWYISFTSYSSPPIAVSRFFMVDSPPYRTLWWFVAWTFSANAMAVNSFATFLNPSFAALSAKARYFMWAWLSPAKAAFRFSLVFGLMGILLLEMLFPGIFRGAGAGPAIECNRNPRKRQIR